MVDRNLLREYDVSEEELEKEISESLKPSEADDLTTLLPKSSEQAEVGRIVQGRIVDVVNELAVIDVGHKSEGVVPLSEWGENEAKPKPGDTVEVLLEGLEGDGGEVILSKRKAARVRAWERILRECKVGDLVVGKVTRKIKGGLLVDIGVNVFLPASQVDVRRPGDVAEFIGQNIECKILKIDVDRRNIVVSRRKLIEEKREELKRQLLEQLKEGDVVRGTVKNIADFGAFIDLGGVDGLLHITDMSWGRINHPSEVLKLDQELDVKVLHIDRERDKIALGLKQLTPSPWEQVPLKYPVGSKVKGKVVNIVNYGAFVKLEDGVEGLVHISEMSWTKRISHPKEVVKIGDEVEVVVLGINEEKQEISLGIKQAKENPWDRIDEKYPVGSTAKGTVRSFTNYGAFVELEEGVEGLLHVSDISWTQKINQPAEVLKKGQQVECKVLDIDRQRKRLSLGIKQLRPDPWETEIPEKYPVGAVVKGKVTKLTSFGVFVELERGLEGLLHISELTDRKVHHAHDEVSVGEELEVKVIRVDPKERKIGLSRRQLIEEAKTTAAEEAPAKERRGRDRRAKAAQPLKGGVGEGSGPLIDLSQSGTDQKRQQHGQEQAHLVGPAAGQEGDRRIARGQSERRSHLGGRAETRRQLHERVPHELHRHAGLLVDRHFEREDDQHLVRQSLHDPQPAGPPRPELRADVVDDRDAESPHRGREPEV